MTGEGDQRSTIHHPAHKKYNLGLIGFPLGHSLSPQLHHAALKAMGLQGEYRLYPIPPLPEGLTALHTLLDRLQAGDIQGLNVTIPHKQNVLPRLIHTSPTVAAVGAANTLFLRENELFGENTDIPGFLSDLEDLKPFSSSIALVLGAGGAARAAVYAMLSAGWQVILAARRIEQARELAASLQTALHPSLKPISHTIPLESASLTNLLNSINIGLIVNTTPVGMFPHPNASPWQSGVPFPPQAAVYDMIYNPGETMLLKQARSAGLKVKNGLGMLVEQAALALELWTGLPVPRKAMWDAVLPKLEDAHAA